MKPYYQDKWVTILNNNCLEVLPELNGASAIVTDPPYELGFMGKSWDSKGISFQIETWQTIRNSCKSGAMLLSFGGTRTFHRIACAIEDAGFEIRDTIAWVYGSGFPKSLDVSKAIDYDSCRKQLTDKLGRQPTKEEMKSEWAEFRVVAGKKYEGMGCKRIESIDYGKYDAPKELEGINVTKPATPEAQLWSGYGTALKPAYEPIIVAMNPLDGTFANNALKHGVAGLNIDECRISKQDGDRTEYGVNGIKRSNNNNVWGKQYGEIKFDGTAARFPANLIHDGSQVVMELFPNSKTGNLNKVNTGIWGSCGLRENINHKGTNGSAARFFYCAKSSKSERNKGCEELEDVDPHTTYAGDVWSREHMGNTPTNKREKVKNNHPTVKPLALMEYLVKLVKMPEYNLIIDPFMGSGTTLLACIKLGIPCIGIDNDEHTCEIAAKRCSQEVMELDV